MVLASALIAALLGPSPLASAESAPPQLHRQGRWLVDQHGRVVIVHGLNLVWKRPPYVPPNTAGGFTDADATWLADHGFNGARIGTLWAGIQPDGPATVDRTYFDKWQRVMDRLAKYGIWMQLDFHQDQWNEVYGGEGAPAWATKRPVPFNAAPPINPQFPLGYWTPEQSLMWDQIWADKTGVLDAWANAWGVTAQHWRNQPYSMGYDLLNEPFAGIEWPTCLLNGCPSHYTKELQPAMVKALRKVRAVDPKGIVWFEPQQLSGGIGSPTNFTAVPGENQLGFSWHNYCPQVFFESVGLPAQNAEDCASYDARIHPRRLSEANEMNAVGLMSEFGATDNLTGLRIDADAADKFFTSWMYWAYKTWNDPTTADTAQGLFVDDADLSSTKPKVNTLVRTYPQATCGTPKSLSFDKDTGAFAYTYVAGSCGGSPTEIFVSPLHYPHGSKTRVTGGTLAGTASHHRILVRATKGKTVTVTIARS